jgi:phosphoglycolate phosphatase-like HAD superfamily hydrolase
MGSIFLYTAVAAKAAGMLAIAALWGGIFLAGTLLAEQPDYVTEQPGELLDIFSQRHG